jgi:charged multivesicular body protein 4
MVNFFGNKQKRSAAPAGQSALEQITRMKKVSDNLEKREKFLENKVNDELKKAIERKRKGDLNGAKNNLKRKMMFQKDIDVLSNSRIKLETQILTIEAATISGATVRAMDEGRKLLHKLSNQNDLEKVQAMMDEIAERTAMADELNNILAAPLNEFATDDFELESELEALLDYNPAAASVDVPDMYEDIDDEDALLKELGDLAPPTAEQIVSKRRSIRDIVMRRSSKKVPTDPFESLPNVPSINPRKGSVDEDEEELALLAAALA